MKSLLKLIVLGVLATLFQPVIADHIITMFLQTYPHFPLEQATNDIRQKKANKKSKKLQSPAKIAQYTWNSVVNHNPAAGIFATYAGQLTASGTDGQLTFARRQESPQLKLLITEKMEPIFQVGTTIQYWELKPDVPAALYSITQDRDQDTEIEFWKVERSKLPKNRKISIDTIIIFAKPETTYVPEGITPIKHPGADLVLPDIFIKKSIDSLASSLYILNLKRLFAQVQNMYQVKDKGYRIITY
jgi:hypothetical protein